MTLRSLRRGTVPDKHSLPCSPSDHSVFPVNPTSPATVPWPLLSADGGGADCQAGAAPIPEPTHDS